MEDTINNDLAFRDFKKRAIIACPHPVFREMIVKTLHISTQVILQPPQAFDNPSSICWTQGFEILFGFGFEFNAVIHGCRGYWRCGSDSGKCEN